MDCSLPGFSVHGIFQARILEWDSHSVLQGIFLTQGSNPGLLCCRQILYCLSHQRNPCRSSVSSVTPSCPTLCDPMDYSTPSFPVHYQLLELVQTHVHWVSDGIQPSHPLPSPSPPATIFPSIRVFSNEASLGIRWPKYWSFSFSISPSNEHPGLISFRMDWSPLEWTGCISFSPRDSWESLGPQGKPVNLKGNQPWIFIGRIGAETEAPILWPPDVKSWFTGKDPDAEQDWGKEEKGVKDDEMVGWHHWLNGHELEQILGDSEGQ